MNRYQYTACGLSNVHITGADFTEVIDGDEYVTIPQIGLLHTIILVAIFSHKNAMSPQELRFSRIELGLTQDEMSDLLKKRTDQIESWERGGQAMDHFSEIFVRQMIIDAVRERAKSFKEFDIDIFPLLASVDRGIAAVSRRVVRSARLQEIEIEFSPEPSPSGCYKLLQPGGEHADERCFRIAI